MDTLRVDISYRPLRIAWAILAGDFSAFRLAVRYSHALWGGRFNPILIIDREAEARQLIDLFRVDIITPIGESNQVKHFPKKYGYLISPFFHDALFVQGGDEHHRSYSQVLDVHNALAYFRDKPELKAIKDHGMRLFTWQAEDPLADVLLSQLGGYPEPDAIGRDYRALVQDATEGSEFAVDPGVSITTDTIDYPSISYLGRHGLTRHHNVDAGREYPGFFVGSAASLDDLVCHWNLRACDVPLWFVDPQHLRRYDSLIPAWESAMRERVANYRHEWDRDLAIWTRQDDLSEAARPFGEAKLVRCHVSEATWNGLNVRAPTMQFGAASVLGVVSNNGGKPKVSFALGGLKVLVQRLSW